MPTHVMPAERLREGHRILLKDLRILTVEGTPLHSGEDVVVKYHDLARKEHDSMTIACERQVKTICHNDGTCPICKIIEDII